ncbi:MAG: T9SS type A sorting domain-containing protein [Candidatus Aegiribacteria sp.]|nr:T9SS type A sorting domain-containing protein [Candidatus Aegiribacteria sp.]
MILDLYRDHYLGIASRWAEEFYREFLLSARASGVNAILIRDEPREDAEQGPPYDRLLPVATQARTLGLNVMIGGFTNSGGDGSGETHNAKVLEVLSNYEIQSPPRLQGDWIAIHGFDEPDNSGTTYLEDFESVSALVNSNFGIPFGTFLAAPASSIPSLVDPYLSTIYGTLAATTFNFWSNIDYGMFDWYPSLVWSNESNFTTDQVAMRGVCDLIQSEGNYYSAYTTRDEVWSITREQSAASNGDITVFRISNVMGEDAIGNMYLQPTGETLQINTPWPFVTTSSSIQSNDCGDRSTGSHNLSSALVCWNPGGELSPDARVIFNNGSDIIKDTFPGSIGSEYYSNVLFSVGELDYLMNRAPSGLCTGVIGHSDLRILWCGQEKSTGAYAVAVFGKNSLGNDISLKSALPAAPSMQLPSGFIPEGAVWGRFWGAAYPHRRSGFILYESGGDYVVVYNDIEAPTETWVVSSPYTYLFDEGMVGSAVTPFRDLGENHFTPAVDRIVAVVNPIGSEDVKLIHGSSGWDSDNPGKFDFDNVFTTCDLYNFSFSSAQDVQGIGFEGVGRSGPRFFFIDSNGNYEYSKYTSGFPSSEDIEYDGCSEWQFIGTIRNRHTKRAFTDVLIEDLRTTPRRLSMMNNYTSTASTAIYPDQASQAIYFGNMCSEAPYINTLGTGAYDLEYQYGVASTSRSNALMANVQSYGRAMQSSLRTCPGTNITGSTVNNDLLYLTVAPIVHGARGLSFYSLGMALRSDAVGPGAGVAGFPDVMTSWGPSPDGSTNVNMVARIHDTVEMLTGNQLAEAPNFLDIILDDANYTILDADDAFNAFDRLGTNPALNSKSVNFLAFEHNQTGDIYMLMCRDAEDEVPYIVFINHIADDFGSIECFGGWDPTSGYCQQASSAECLQVMSHSRPDREIRKLAIYCTEMPLYSASLLRIPYTGSDDLSMGDEVISPVLECRLNTNGNSEFEILNATDNTSLRVFDVSGRLVLESDVNEPGIGNTIRLDRSVLGTGMYLIVLHEGTSVLETTKIVVF